MNSQVTRALWATLAIAPPGTVAAYAWNMIKQSPALAAMALLIYWIALIAASLLADIYSGLRNRWTDRLIERSDGELRRRVTNFRARYLYLIVKLHHDVDLRGLTTRGDYALAVKQVFVDLSLVSRPAHETTGNPLTGASRDDGARRSIWDLLSGHDPAPLAVLGAPGSGKTTLLKHVALTLATGRDKPKTLRRVIPILLFLREHAETIVANPDVSVANLASKQLERFNAAEPPGWFEAKLRRGRCVVMLDGLDEVADQSHRRTVVDWTERQVVGYSANRFILTSRPFGYQPQQVNSATVVQVRGFTDEQVERFVRGWYRATMIRSKARDDMGVAEEARTASDDLLERLRAATGLLPLTTNPLLLTMIAHVHHYRGALPGTRIELYREICQVLLGKRQEAKGLYGEVKTDQKEFVLQSLAYEMMIRGVRDIRSSDAAEIISEALRSVDPHLDSHSFLRGIEQDSGLLVEKSSNTYSFAHLTFQEYLAATWIRDHHLVGTLIHNIRDDWWRETTLLYVAQAEAKPIVAACLAVGRDINALALAADCADEARDLPPELRNRLNVDLADALAEPDPLRRRLITSVLLTRKMRHTIRTEAGSHICTQPVTGLEYAYYLHREVRGNAPYLTASNDAEGAAAPVSGILPGDVSGFIEWVKGHDLNIRLPRPEDLTRDLLKRFVSGDTWQVWVRARRETLPMLIFGSVKDVYFSLSYSEEDIERDLRVVDDERTRAHWRASISPFSEHWICMQTVTLPAPCGTLAQLREVGRSFLEIANSLDGPFYGTKERRAMMETIADVRESLSYGVWVGDRKRQALARLTVAGVMWLARNPTGDALNWGEAQEACLRMLSTLIVRSEELVSFASAPELLLLAKE